jgi:hypothetical protein
VQPLVAEDAGAVGVCEWHKDDIADLHFVDVGADTLHDTDGLVPHPAADLARLHQVVRPQVAAADGGSGDADDSVGWLDQAGVGDVHDTDVAGAVHNTCVHENLRDEPATRLLLT